MTAPPPLVIKNSGLAVASLVLGILSVVLIVLCIGPLFGIPAVICGHIALVKIKQSSGMIGGRGMAIAGLVTGYSSLVLLPLLAAIAIPNFTKARDSAQRNACVIHLRSIDLAKQQWALENHKSADDVPTEEDLARYIPGGVMRHCPRGGEYVIGKVSEAPTCSIPGHELTYRQSYVPSNSRPLNQRVSQFAPTNLGVNNDQLREAMKTAQCQGNLRTIAAAKRSWQLRNNRVTGDLPTTADLMPYLPGRHMPICPDGGTYEIGTIGENPTCPVAGHQLPNAP